MTEFVLVRHALPVAGHPDPELSVEGREQARRLGRWLAAERFDAIIASPLRRAVETAAIVAVPMTRKCVQPYRNPQNGEYASFR